MARPFKITGTITDIFRPEASGTFTKRVFWLKEPDTERYPQHWELELHNDDGKRLDRFQVGQRVEAEVELRGRKWEGQGKVKVFNSLKCLGLQLAGEAKNPFK